MLQFQKLNYSKRDQFWLVKFFQIPISRTPDQFDQRIVGYSSERLKKFWNLSSLLLNLIYKSLIISSTLAMSLSSVTYMIEMLKYSHLHTPLIFYTILIVNYVSLTLVGSLNAIIVLGPVAFLYLNCRILNERFELAICKLKRQIHDFDKMRRHLREFNSIIDDLQRCDHFWSNYIFANYYLSIFVCSILFLISKYFLIALSFFKAS